ncbi:MAG: Gfo/Idh/MocA family oxidoreductase, partial [Desulfobacterales bacterium]
MPIKIIQVGAGLRGSHWLEYVRDYPDATTVAVVDADQSALSSAQKIVESDACGFFRDLSEAVKKTEADAVIIASPSYLH